MPEHMRRVLQKSSGGGVALSSLENKKPIVLFFYPKVNAATCISVLQTLHIDGLIITPHATPPPPLSNEKPTTQTACIIHDAGFLSQVGTCIAYIYAYPCMATFHDNSNNMQNIHQSVSP